MSFFTTYFHFFFGLPFFKPSTIKSFAFTGTFSSSDFFTCANHCKLCSLKNSSIFSTSSFQELFHYLCFTRNHAVFSFQYFATFFCLLSPRSSIRDQNTIRQFSHTFYTSCLSSSATQPLYTAHLLYPEALSISCSCK